MQQRRVDRADLQLDAAGVHRLFEGDVGPVEARLAHVDADQTVARPAGAQPAAAPLPPRGVYIGSASRRERVYIAVVAVSVKKKKTDT